MMDPEAYQDIQRFQGNHWWYQGRRSVVRRLFRAYVRSSDRRGAYLDVGCGTGEGARIIGPAGEIHGVDVSAEALALAEGQGYASLRQGTGENLGFPDGCFDGALALDVLEHVEDDAAMLRECARVLRPGGILILTVPAYRWLWSGHDEVFGHRRRYVRSELMEKIKTASFDIRLASYYFFFLFPVVAATRLVERLFRNKRTSHFFVLPTAINRILIRIVALESRLLRRGVRFPWGSSLIVVARKPIASISFATKRNG